MTNIKASESTIRATAAALGRSALFDDKITENDTGRLAAWAEALEPFKFDVPDVLDAVTAYYQDNNNGRTIQVSDIIRNGRTIRRDRAEREKADAESRAAFESAQDHRLGLAAPNAALGGLPIPTVGDAVWTAYDVNGAIDRPCPHCGADINDACVDPGNQRPTRIPCLARLVGKASFSGVA